MNIKDYHVVLSVTDRGNILDHKPLAQYWRLRYAISATPLNSVTLTMPRIDIQGTVYNSEPIAMNLDSFLNAHGFSNADIRRWLEHKRWTRTGTLLLFKVSFNNNVLNYTLVGKVEKDRNL